MTKESKTKVIDLMAALRASIEEDPFCCPECMTPVASAEGPAALFDCPNGCVRDITIRQCVRAPTPRATP